MCKLLGLVLFALLIGLLLYMDNFAHIGGLVTGVLLNAIFLPYYPPYDGEEAEIPHSYKDKFRKVKISLVAICLQSTDLYCNLCCYICRRYSPIILAINTLFSNTICKDQQLTPENHDRNLYAGTTKSLFSYITEHGI